MKGLTYSSMATARLRANKKSYVSLVLGIFLSIFLISSLVLTVYGIYHAELEKRYDKVGYLDMVIMDNSILTEERLQTFDEFDRLGHAYISGVVTDRNVYAGYYDEVGLSLMNLEPLEGRLPEAPGEIALEVSAMDVLEVQWTIGETVELAITPVDGTEEIRSFTVVGFLPERSVYLEISDNNGLSQFPAIVTSPQEPGFSVGRLGTHYLLGLAKYVNLDMALDAFWNKYSLHDIMHLTYGLSISGEQRQYTGGGNRIDADREMFDLIAMACVLAAALILSCGVGISGAMEGVLSKRREEIGVLRALGATRRQIRRMFGRENLILAVVVSPLSIAVSCAAVWGLSILMPESLVFTFNFWLLLPIALFSAAVILMSGYLPLVRASKLMPMSVIRDTAMLRRSKGVKYKREFSAAKLISARQIRFNPTRQIGASLLVGLMLLCSGLLMGLMANYRSYTATDSPGFYIRTDAMQFSDNHVNYYAHPSMSKQSISQLRKLDHVESIQLGRYLTVSLLLDAVPRYAMLDASLSQLGMLSDEMFQEALSYFNGDDAFHERLREAERQRYLQFLKDHDIPGEVFDTVLITIDLNAENLDMLNRGLESGKINVDAIHAGAEVIVLAPEVWVKPIEDSGGYRYWYSEAAANNDPAGEGAQLAAWNDSFAVGQDLPILQLYQTEINGPIYREDANVTIGAVISNAENSLSSVRSHVYVITTEQGLENMGLRVEGLEKIAVYLDGELSMEEEAVLERQLTAISRRSAGYSVFNQVESFRELEQGNQQQILLFFSVVTVFFAVAVGMIVSSVTRQLNSEGRTIGMLRAVGADERAILGCYSGQVTASAAGGLGISLGLLFLYMIFYLVDALQRGSFYVSSNDIKLFVVMTLTICIMGAACWLVCRNLLRFRIREIVRRSIIDNIREL